MIVVRFDGRAVQQSGFDGEAGIVFYDVRAKFSQFRRHRGNAVCRAEEGHATSFMCTYHGWTYDLKGNLVGVPGFKEVYHEELDRENWGLIRAAQVDSYKGFVFATMDPEAPSLPEYLGDVGRLSIDYLAEQGDMEVIGGVHKLSTLVQWIKVDVIEVAANRVVLDRRISFRGDSDEAWERAQGFVSREIRGALAVR